MPRKKIDPNVGKKTQFKSGAQAAEAGRKGGIKQGENRKKKKAVCELAAAMMEQAITGKAADTIKKQFPQMEEDDMTMAAVVLAGQFNGALKGDTRAASYLVELTDRAREKQEAEERKKQRYAIDLRKVPLRYHGFIQATERHMYTQHLLKGGRGSMKSSTVALDIINLVKQNPGIHALAMRQVGNTIKDSVYAKLKWAINILDLEDEFDPKTSPMEITYKPTGQKIYFRGADDPGKLKSITPEFGYIGILWFEELDQFGGPEAVRNIEQSAIRGGDVAWIFKTFNPPITKSNWANQYAMEPQEGKLVDSSTYEQLEPYEREWLGKPFLDEADHLRQVNPTAYAHEYGGEAVGLGTEIFPFLEIRTITDDEIAQQERIYQGQDWGWSPDPKAFIRLSYNHSTETIMLIDEDGGTMIRTRDMAARIKDKGYDDFEVRCGVDEKEHITDFRDAGLLAREAIVTPGSVKRTHEWLQCRKIIIDPARTPRACKEFTEYSHDVDAKTGEVIDGYPDRNNHWIDAVRYATSPLSMRRGESA